MNVINNRVLVIKGGYNFRDLGGLSTKDGKIIKKDLLFRTDELCNLQSEDLDLLARLDVKTIVDFRTDQERAQSIDKVPVTCKKQIHLDILAANMNALMAEFQKEGANYKQLLLNFYTDLVLSENAITEYSKFFEILQNADNTSIIYHCTAGKDRTGVATMLILSALNVDYKQIEDDYLLSNQFLKKKYETYINQNPALADLFLVRAEYLENAINAINVKYDSVQNYLKTVLKVDLDLMRNIYTK